MPPRLITLDVSGRKYQTLKATLQTSPYFQNLLARWDDCSDRKEDGSYFIDADADLFQHVLGFMRRPSKFPLFWTKENGFDHVLYSTLEAEADYFLLHDLRDWIRNKRYQDAVRTSVDVEVLAEGDFDQHLKKLRSEPYAEVRTFFGSYSGAKRFRSACEVHPRNDEPMRGCLSCYDLMRVHGPHYDDPEKKLTVVTTRTHFDETVCVNENIARE